MVLSQTIDGKAEVYNFEGMRNEWDSVQDLKRVPEEQIERMRARTPALRSLERPRGLPGLAKGEQAQVQAENHRARGARGSAAPPPYRR